MAQLFDFGFFLKRINFKKRKQCAVFGQGTKSVTVKNTEGVAVRSFGLDFKTFSWNAIEKVTYSVTHQINV